MRIIDIKGNRLVYGFLTRNTNFNKQTSKCYWSDSNAINQLGDKTNTESVHIFTFLYIHLPLLSEWKVKMKHSTERKGMEKKQQKQNKNRNNAMGEIDKMSNKGS